MNIFHRLYARPWLIHDPALDTMRQMALTISPEAVRDRKLPAMDETPEDLAGRPMVRTFGNVAIVPITGPLFHNEDAFFDEIMAVVFGGTSYDAIAAAVNAAIDDPSIDAICLYVNSPGGEVSGCSETAEILKAAAAVKPMVAYAAYMCCSASYWLASAASKIVCAPTALIGSIGVRASLVDDSEALKKNGYARFDFVAKQSPHKLADPKTEKGRQQIQAEIDALGEVFVQTMAANRNVTVAKVLADFGGGDVLVGQDAVKVGLADQVGSLKSVLADLQTSEMAGSKARRKPSTKRTGKSASAPVPKDPSMTLAQRIAKLFANSKTTVKAEAVDALIETAEAEGLDLDKILADIESEAKPIVAKVEAKVEDPIVAELRKKVESLEASQRETAAKVIASNVKADVTRLVKANKILPASIKPLLALRHAAERHSAGLPVPEGFSFAKALDEFTATLPDHQIGNVVARADMPADAHKAASEALALLDIDAKPLPSSENEANAGFKSKDDLYAHIKENYGRDLAPVK